MGGLDTPVVIQEINLYRPVASATSLNPGARMLLFTAVAVFAGVIALAFLGELYLSGMQVDRDAAAERLAQSRERLVEAEARLVPPPTDPFLESEFARLNETTVGLQATLDTLTEHRANTGIGFSAVFNGLARNTIDGLWFDRVDLRAGGALLSLRGQALQPALVPQLLQSLADEPAFAGRNFRKVSFERRTRETDAVIDFELQSAPAQEPNREG